jgi:hypothetical protein
MSLHAVMRALAIAVVLSFGFSAVSIAYAAGRHAGHTNSIGSAWADSAEPLVFATHQ